MNKDIPKELCGPDSPVDWTYPETGQTKPQPEIRVKEIAYTRPIKLTPPGH